MIFGNSPLDLMLPQVPSTLYPVPSAPDAPVEEQARAAKKVKVSAFGRPCFLSCVNFKIQNTDLELEDGARQRALEKWYFMLTLDTSVSLVGSSLAGLNLSESMQALRELFGRKSEATVSKRASALIRYVKFLRGCEPACNPFPFSTERADVYMRFLKSNQAKPGAVDAFTEAVKFAIHVVGISCQGEPSKIFSPWSMASCNARSGSVFRPKSCMLIKSSTLKACWTSLMWTSRIDMPALHFCSASSAEAASVISEMSLDSWLTLLRLVVSSRAL